MPANLFRPSFGTYPHVLVGRDELVDEFADTFDGILDPAGLTVLLSGQRGMGKTVLLDSYRRAAEGAGWLVITESSSSGLLERLTRDHLPRLLQAHSDESPARLASASGTIGPLGGGASWTERYPAESTLRSQITELTDALRPSGRGLVITVDEVQAADIEDLRKLGEIIQYGRREDRLLAFAAAGLSTPIEELLDHPGTTFLRRAEHHPVGRVSRAEVRAALAGTIADSDREIDVQALDLAADAVDGYPFMIQLVGYHSLKAHRASGPITSKDVTEGIAAARRRLGRHIHAPALRPLSSVDRTYLLAMAQDEGPSRTAKIAERMGVNTTYAGQYRRRLIRDGIIEPAGHGFVRFTIPYTAEHLREHAAHDALEGLSSSEE
ncbi:ATP-binding protein [Brachybacterium kimchii]|uniref:ATP-binding protein n=1 Tax=Brachybacterium kimchii TaxID=2942909 RepID=A0ABY4NB24_9MICO|nr:ATP-binding protein [Brachybacterium kimchii]UQN31773.1 ATP-binding protein [Brachybacterium kimchii]